MPKALEAPMLQVDPNVIHKVDTTNPANLFSMWTIFARCCDSVVWNHDTFCYEGEEVLQPRIQKQDSSDGSRSRGRERHITSDELKKMVVSIVEAKVPLNAPLPSIPRSQRSLITLMLSAKRKDA